ncbi:type I secretion system permease/ATPase [Neisseriaceae bacterium JH1-16]|nr:type I secretion system permease/ATPase [Neisseriaceae bacterium JH1-16]
MEYEAKVDTGLQCLLSIAALHGIAADEAQIRHQLGGERLDEQNILLAAKSLGLKSKAIRQDPERLQMAPLPAITQNRHSGKSLIVAQCSQATDKPLQLLIQYPGEPPTVISRDEFIEMWTGTLLLFTSKASFAGEMAKFDFTWFVPAIIRYRRILTEVLVISLVIQSIGLVTPMFFQVVMDKVLVNHAMRTLDVIAIGLICSIIFEVVLTGIRSWVFSYTSNKIDVELGARLFRHLLALPLSYFHSRRVGDSVARIRELENIRSFLTGNALTLVLDILFSLIFFGVMLWYSPTLTLIVALSIPLYVGISLLVTPVVRKRLDEKFNKGAENQSFLVETISGIDTVKALAVEPRWIQKWEKQLAGYVTAGQSVNNVATISNAGVTLISKLVTAAIMWMGALLVIDNKLTVGELVAFNMLAGQVSSPILRLAQLWNDFQQVGISVSRLGDVLNAQPEVAGQKTRLPRLSGSIEFDNVGFRYRPDASDVLRGVNLKVEPGQVIGIVGRSGSGKSTLTRLAQRLYVPNRGRVLIDGQDIAVIDTASLRQQVGVVLQENVLFNRSIRDNIALINPSLPIEAVIHAAKLAGAHEFICELSDGYDTVVGENGTGLSGGQRQRIAIARALIGDPRILIFDEATSALDYESEKIIQDNMRSICKGRTVLIIAHRLSAVRDAHRIIVMERGEVAESGTHEELLVDPNGIYTHLNSLQQGLREKQS